jgi:hypothetical protein
VSVAERDLAFAQVFAPALDRTKQKQTERLTAKLHRIYKNDEKRNWNSLEMTG